MFGRYLDTLKHRGGLIYNITNYVTANDVANILLACGSSPILSDEIEEVEEMIALSDGININIGTLNLRTIETMKVAGKKANEMRKVVVLDPVGVGASKLRFNTSLTLLNEIQFDVVKGNISEIKYLINSSGSCLGVDADKADEINEENIESFIEMIKNFSKKINSVVVVTGKYDFITDGDRTFIIKNGRSEMEKITGTGCQLSAMITAFVTANPKMRLEATVAAVATMGVAGELAWREMNKSDGNMRYRDRIIDKIFNMNGEILDREVRYEIR